MLQRIQTLFLIGFVACMVLLFFAPVWTKSDSATGKEANLNGYSLTITDAEGEVEDTVPAVWIVLVAGMSAGIGIYSIMRYDNRMLQMKLGLVQTLFVLGTVGLMFLMARQGEGKLPSTHTGTFLWGFYLPLVALMLNSVARRFIYRDERMVREANRIR